MSPLFGLLCPGSHRPADDPVRTDAAVPAPTRAVLAWPLPAVLAWTCGWAVWRLGTAAGLVGWAAFGLAVITATALASVCTTRWRRAIAAGGFPLAVLALGAGALPPWAWLAMLLPLLVAYPLRAWRDAPFFPTPAGALAGVDAVISVPPQRVLDAGCGLGHGLQAIRAVWPGAELIGLEWSPALSMLARLRCRHLGARVQRADMWAASWSGCDLVYLFQRPESMARAFAKARAELAPGAWFVSLEFAVPNADACLHCCLQGPGRRALWIYRLPGATAVHSTTPLSRR